MRNQEKMSLAELTNADVLGVYTEAVQDWQDVSRGDDERAIHAVESRLVLARTEILRRMGETAHLGSL